MKTTIKDIAKIAGVSHVTVSKALNNAPGVNEETKNNIFAIAQELNYIPNIAARRLVNKKLNTIGLIWPKTEGFFFYHLCNSIQEEALKRGMNTMISTADPDVSLHAFNEHFIEMVITWVDSGCCASPEFSRERKIFQGELLVLGGGYADNSHKISINRSKGIYLAVKHLVELGHRKITFLGGQNEKMIGFLQGMLEFSLQYHTHYLLNITGEKDEQAEQEFNKLISDKDRPTAIIADSHRSMTTLVKLLRKHQFRIPDDFSLIVYDNIPEVQTMLDVPVTTVGPSIKQMAGEAISILLDKMSDTSESKWIETEILPELIIRGTTKKLQVTV